MSLATEVRPQLGELVLIGQMAGKVARIHEKGIAIEFVSQAPADKAALERQQFVQARLGQLRQRLSKLSSIDITQIPSDKVGLGSQVVVQDELTGQRESYSLVFGDSVEFEEGHVSMSSPIGKTLVGRSVGETVVLKLPAMTRRLKIIELKTIHDAA